MSRYGDVYSAMMRQFYRGVAAGICISLVVGCVILFIVLAVS